MEDYGYCMSVNLRVTGSGTSYGTSVLNRSIRYGTVPHTAQENCHINLTTPLNTLKYSESYGIVRVGPWWENISFSSLEDKSPMGGVTTD